MPSKYMGIPLGVGVLKKASWQELLDRMKQRLSSLVLRPLNLPSWLVLVKVVLQAMPIYLFLILSTPKSVLHEIRSIQRNFLWGGREAKAKFSLVSWDGICKPKDQGGLGLRDPDVMVEVQGAKLWWRWSKYTEEPWAKIWNIKYARDKPKDQLVHLNVDLPGSPIWRKVMGGRRLVQDHCFWEIQNGESANF